MWPLGQGRLLTSLLYRVSFENRAPLLKQKFESHCILSINVYSTFSTFQALKHLDYISRQTVKATGDKEVGRKDVGLVKIQLLRTPCGPWVRTVIRVV